MKLTKKEAHEYWKNPPEENRPIYYYHGNDRSMNLVAIIERYCTPLDSILELGCNVGRNLRVLEERCFNDLYGIDINEESIDMTCVPNAGLMRGSLEDILPQIPDRKFDVVFSMATLMHISNESEWILKDIARITNRILIIIEKESFEGIADDITIRCYDHDYSIFNMFGFSEIYKDFNITMRGYITRVFKHES
ncbi:hypothetical protein LCGC14_1278920 [marine sediment metagenome]|uniref:Methyltransferase type 11 domain-containing protein n=1 Tax=marine sediment metagenome TaxID=412755 RepID=A0A0F9KXJ4_9ZZZZ